MLSIILIGVSLSMDAFAIALTNGLTVKGYKLRHAVITAAYFGFFQFLMPLIGCFLAGTVSHYVSMLGPYISFFLLAFIGIKMIREGLQCENEETCSCGSPAVRLSHKRLLAMAVATSIDALAVGVSFAFMEVQLVPSCLVIGAVTFVICLAGGFLGKNIPGLSGKKAEILGGVILVGIGVKLLIEGIIG